MGMIDILSNDYVGKNCKKNDELCKYLHKTSLKDINDDKVILWECDCEEEMCVHSNI